MLFNSLQYAFFLPLVFLIHWLLPHRFRIGALLAASLYFYMSWNPPYILLLILAAVVSYTAGLFLDPIRRIKSTGSEKPAERKDRAWILRAAVSALLLFLFIFKYSGLILETLYFLAERFTLVLDSIFQYKLNFYLNNDIIPDLKSLPIYSFYENHLILPLGISFYTFQAIAYIVDVYKGRINAERSFLVYLCFLSFFPQLVAGPIERSKDLLPQIRAERNFSYDDAAYGMRIMAIGFFKKLVIADTLSIYVDRVFSNLYFYSGFSLFIALAFFSIQIYCDFSGYSDIALGSAGLFGIRLSRNFKSPYLSESIQAFWQRWHISLSGWFRDYVYIPLGGNREGEVKRDRNLFLTFLLSGLWHGANWTYACWGALHGIAVIIEGRLKRRLNINLRRDLKVNLKRDFIGNLKREKRDLRRDLRGILKRDLRRNIIEKLKRNMRAAGVFLFCTLAWPFFRGESISEAVYIYTNILNGISAPLSYLHDGFAIYGIERWRWLMLLFSVILLLIYDIFSSKCDPIKIIAGQKFLVRQCAYLLILLFILFFRASGETAFVYFQF